MAKSKQRISKRRSFNIHQTHANVFIKAINEAHSDNPDVMAAVLRMREKFLIPSNCTPFQVSFIILSEPAFLSELLLSQPGIKQVFERLSLARTR